MGSIKIPIALIRMHPFIQALQTLGTMAWTQTALVTTTMIKMVMVPVAFNVEVEIAMMAMLQ